MNACYKPARRESKHDGSPGDDGRFGYWYTVRHHYCKSIAALRTTGGVHCAAPGHVILVVAAVIGREHPWHRREVSSKGGFTVATVICWGDNLTADVVIGAVGLWQQ